MNDFQIINPTFRVTLISKLSSAGCYSCGLLCFFCIWPTACMTVCSWGLCSQKWEHLGMFQKLLCLGIWSTERNTLFWLLPGLCVAAWSDVCVWAQRGQASISKNKQLCTQRQSRQFLKDALQEAMPVPLLSSVFIDSELVIESVILQGPYSKASSLQYESVPFYF